jgi:hypothetical protein
VSALSTRTQRSTTSVFAFLPSHSTAPE